MEMIVRINSTDADVEVLFNDSIASEIIEKKISLKKFIDICNGHLNQIHRDYKTTKVKKIEKNVIGYISSFGFEKYLINQPEHNRYVTWSFSDQNGGCKINFPNAIYEITVKNNQIKDINAYMYLEWKNYETELYKYAMPNMLFGNEICIGNAKKEIDNNLIQTLENIIYSPYSHFSLSNVKGFSNTEEYLRYLENNKVQKEYLYKLDLKLKDLYE